METQAYDFFRSGAVSQHDLDELPNRVRQLMPSAWLTHGKFLIIFQTGALGRFDGKVYKDLFHRAHRRKPLNELAFNPNYWENELVKEDSRGWLSVLAKL